MKNSMEFSKTDFQKYSDHYNQNFKLLDNTLYALCKDNYAHDNMDMINAKLWIIGRTYATGIERKITTNGYQGGSLSQLAKHLYTNKQRVEDIFSKLKSIYLNTTTLSAENLEIIVSLHWQFVELTTEITRNKQSTRSFVSKYMHFHCPIVPVYDSFASTTLKKFIRWDDKLMVFGKPKPVDEEYLWFTLRFLELYKQASEYVEGLKVKYLDYYLLCVADELKSKEKALS